MVFVVLNYSVSHILRNCDKCSLERLTFRREHVLIARSQVLWIRGGIESVKILMLRSARTRLPPSQIGPSIVAGSLETYLATRIGLSPGRLKLLSASETCGDNL
jgi:hypothetical protein